MSTEYAVFRKGGDEHDAPMQNLTFKRYDRAEAFIAQFINGPEWLEVRTRQVTDWLTITAKPKHHCEEWQLLPHPDGGLYCSVCGRHEGDRK